MLVISFSGFFRSDLSPWGYRSRRFLVALCHLMVRRLVGSDHEASPLTGKNTGVVLVALHTWKCVSTAISNGVDISEARRCHLLRHMNSQLATKITSRVGVWWTHNLPFCFLLIFNSTNYGHIKRMSTR